MRIGKLLLFAEYTKNIYMTTEGENLLYTENKENMQGLFRYSKIYRKRGRDREADRLTGSETETETKTWTENIHT